jgi:hypothetical protein
MLPVAVRFRATPGDTPNRAGTELRDGFDAQGQTIRLDLTQGPEVAGALAWAALAKGGHALEIDARGLADPVALAAGATLRAWSPRSAPRGMLSILCDAPRISARLWARSWPGIAGNLFARDLVVRPANDLTPAAFVQALQTLSRHGLQVTVHDRTWLEHNGYGALSAVFMAFFVLFVPETKGVSLESIEQKLLAGTPLRQIGK